MADHEFRQDRPRCVFVTVLWGDWHRRMFLEANLPTLLAAGNLPAFTAGVDCEYVVYTTPKDAAQMLQSAAFQRLRSVVDLSIKLFEPATTKNPIGLHHDIWRAATEHARERAAFILLMPPDVAWADGSFRELRRVLLAGKKATFMTYPRVVSETMFPALLERFVRPGQLEMTVPPGELMALALTHIHPLMAAYARDSRHFPVHPEMILWPVADDGFLLRLLAREMFCFEAGRYVLNEQALLARMPPAEEIHLFDDSRKFLGVSFTPLWKDMEWYLRPRTLDPLFTGRWWVRYDSPINDHISSVDLRFTCGRLDEACWTRTGQQASALLTSLRTAREFVRVTMHLEAAGHDRAAAFLAFALRRYGLARRWPHRGPFLVLAPTNAAIECADCDLLQADRWTAQNVRAAIKAHLALLPHPDALRNGGELVTLDGQRLRIETTEQAQNCGPNVILPVTRRLDSFQSPTVLPIDRVA